MRIRFLAVLSGLFVVAGCVRPFGDPAASNYFLEFANHADRTVIVTVEGPPGPDRVRDRATLSISAGSVVRQDVYWVRRGQKVQVRVETADSHWDPIPLAPAGEGERVWQKTVVFRNAPDGRIAWGLEDSRGP